MEDRRLALLAMKMLSLLQSQPEVSEGEAREAARRELEEVQIAFVTLDARRGRSARDRARSGRRGDHEPRARRSRSSIRRRASSTTGPSACTRATSCARWPAAPPTPRSSACAARSRRPRRGSTNGEPFETGGGGALPGPRLADQRRRSRVLRARPDGEGVRRRRVRAHARADERPGADATSASI